jgi:hypothetical protein
MAGMVRAGVVIAAIAWFSPVHQQSGEERLAAARAAPGEAAAAVAAHAPVSGLLASPAGRQLAADAVQAAASEALKERR